MKKKKLFCYRCLRHIEAIYKKTSSEYYMDQDWRPIEDRLPHCPLCNKEVYSIDYHYKVNDFKQRLSHKRVVPIL